MWKPEKHEIAFTEGETHMTNESRVWGAALAAALAVCAVGGIAQNISWETPLPVALIAAVLIVLAIALYNI